MKINIIQLELCEKSSIEIECISSQYSFGIETAGPIFAELIGKANIEMVGILCLDNTNKIINYANIAIGDTNLVNTSLAQIFRIVLLSNASKLIIGHNHPNGVLRITKADIDITKRIGNLCRVFRVFLIDSVVVNMDGKSESIRENMGEK